MIFKTSSKSLAFLLLVAICTLCVLLFLQRDPYFRGYKLGIIKVKWVEPVASFIPLAGSNIVKLDANRFEFKILANKSFGKDKKSVFCNGIVIDGADPATFVAETEGLYARDKYRGYFCSFQIKGSHGPSFRAVKFGSDFKPYEGVKEAWAVDNKFAYSYGAKLEGLASDEFKVFGRFHARDAYNVLFYYQKNKIMDICDIESFKADNRIWSNDDLCLYWRGEKVTNIDGKTLTIYGDYAYDKTKAFYNGKPLIGIDIETFEAFPGGARDKFGCLSGRTRMPCSN